MPRIKRTSQPLLAAQQYVSQHLAELGDLPLRLHILDGSPTRRATLRRSKPALPPACPRGFLPRPMQASAAACAIARCGARSAYFSTAKAR